MTLLVSLGNIVIPTGCGFGVGIIHRPLWLQLNNFSLVHDTGYVDIEAYDNHTHSLVFSSRNVNHATNNILINMLKSPFHSITHGNKRLY